MKLEEIDISNLDMPESIRTPGRTWTRYPEGLTRVDVQQAISPYIEIEGDVDVFRGREAVEKASGKFFSLLRSDENRLNAFHAANVNALIYARVEGNAEIRVKYNENSPVLSHMVVEACENSEVTVTEETESRDFNSSFTEIYVGENASVDYGAVEKPESFSYSRRKAKVEKYGRINWLNGIFNGNLNRTRIDTELEGDGAETDMKGVWYPTGEQHHDISLRVRHLGDNTKCDMDSRSVVDHRARSLYEGLQKVERKAVDTSSFQDQETLMLSDKAESDASPKLMIEDPNVEASHAAATGTVEEDIQHYIESRGLGEDKAERLVVKGFFEPVMRDIQLDSIKESIREEVEKKLDQKTGK